MGRPKRILALTHGSLLYLSGFSGNGYKFSEWFASPICHSFLLRTAHAATELIQPSQSSSLSLSQTKNASQLGITPTTITNQWQDRSLPLALSRKTQKDGISQGGGSNPKEGMSYSAANVVRLCEEDRVKEAVDILENMDHEGIWSLGTVTYSTLLLHCLKKRALAEGKRVHAHIRKAGLQSNFYLGVLLVRMYCACGKMGLARTAFAKTRGFADDERKRNVFIWTVLMRGYVKLGHYTEALRVYKEMIHEGIECDKFVLVTALNACTSLTNLGDGRQIHEEVSRCGLESDPLVSNALIDMYGKCGSTKSARAIFDRMERHNVVSWNSLIAGYTQNGHGTRAFMMFQQMRQDGFKLDRTTYVSVLKACCQLSDLEKGRQVHKLITESEFVADLHLGTALVEMYVTCGSMKDALRVFEKMPTTTLALWNAIIKGAAKFGLHRETIKLFEQMQEKKGKATTDTAVCSLDACANLQSLEDGEAVHDLIMKSGCEMDVLIGNALIDMYSKCGCLKSAQQVFYRMPEKSVVSWNTIIRGCVQNGQSREALKLFKHFQLDDLKPDLETYIIALDACGSLSDPEAGRRVYARAIKKGMGEHMDLVAAVVEMYIRCYSRADAKQVLCSVARPEHVSLVSFLTAHSSRGLSAETILFLKEMDVMDRNQADTLGPKAERSSQ